MTVRVASCPCGQLKVTCSGDPVRISVCHCTACQQRTGSVFVRCRRASRSPENVLTFSGNATTWTRMGDSRAALFRFARPAARPSIGRWMALPDTVAVAVGAVAGHHLVSAAEDLGLRGPQACVGRAAAGDRAHDLRAARPLLEPEA